jgi:hypothetical protein
VEPLASPEKDGQREQNRVAMLIRQVFTPGSPWIAATLAWGTA